MTDKEKRQHRQRTEDAAFNRMLFCLLGVILAEAVILLVKRFYVDVTGSNLGVALALDNIFSVFVYAGLILAILGVVWCVWKYKKSQSIRLPLICTVAVACLWIITLFAYCFYDIGVKLLVALPFAAAVLILIYFLYQRSFFVSALLTGFGMAELWCLRQVQNTLVKVGFVAGWIILIAVAVLTYLLKKNGGKLGKLKLVSDPKSYVPCWITCAVVLVATLLGFILGAGVAYYLIYVLVAWLFCMAVYFTVKMM